MLARATTWAPVALYLGVISYFSHQPSLRPPGGLPDWLMHGIEYALLGLLVARGVNRSSASRPGAWILGAAGCLVFGMLDELHQSFIPGRDASLRDVAADAAGAAVAVAAVALIQFRSRRAAGSTPVIAIYGRRDCHLCDDADEVVRKVAAEFASKIVHVDVDSDPELRKLYGDQVPVVTLNGRKVFKYRVDPARLRERLAALQQRSRG